MQKIPTLFVREESRPKIVTREVTPGCEWVLAGEGVASEKVDGSCCAVILGAFYRRHEHREDRGAPPKGWLHWDLAPNATHGHGWLPVQDVPADRYHKEAWEAVAVWQDGTYELIGPKVMSNPYGLEKHQLRRHGDQPLGQVPLDYDGLRAYLEALGIEGIVWRHEDGRMAKIKRRDLGLRWPINERAA